jgi:hypothetical protein
MLALSWLKQEDGEFEASLSYIGRTRPVWTTQETLSQQNKKAETKTKQN